MRRADVEREHPSIDTSRVRWDRVKNASGVDEEVVLIATGKPPSVVMYSEVVHEYQDHRLLGPTQLRQAQGAEAWQNLEKDRACQQV